MNSSSWLPLSSTIMHYSPELQRFISTPASTRPIAYALRILNLLLCWENHLFSAGFFCSLYSMGMRHWCTPPRVLQPKHFLSSHNTNTLLENTFIIANNSHNQHFLARDLFAKTKACSIQRGKMFCQHQDNHTGVGHRCICLPFEWQVGLVSGPIWGICSSICCLLAWDTKIRHSCLICKD